jgi:aminotransferase in exopolysaccharide biosynthesis
MQSFFEETIAFIRKLYNQPEGLIPLRAPVFIGNEKKYLNECYDSTFVSSNGKYVDLFERRMAEYTGAKYAVATVNGTRALQIALILTGVKPNYEVITQPLTFVATADAIKYCGADPVFLDVDLGTMGLSPKALKKWLEENAELIKSKILTNVKLILSQPQSYNKSTGRRISACPPMHTFGHPYRIDEIVEICEHHNIQVVEDAAESLGSFYKNKHTGTFSKIGILSFNGNKTLTSGGGGIIISNDETLAKRAIHITTTSKVLHPYEFAHDEMGFNYRLPNINAALGVAQLENLELIINNKRETTLKNISFFENLDIEFITEPANAKSN